MSKNFHVFLEKESSFPGWPQRKNNSVCVEFIRCVGFNFFRRNDETPSQIHSRKLDVSKVITHSTIHRTVSSLIDYDYVISTRKIRLFNNKAGYEKYTNYSRLMK